MAVVATVGASCNSAQRSEPVTCVGEGHVSACSQGESDVRWLDVDNAGPGTSVTWTLDGKTLSLQVPGGGVPLRIDLPSRTEAPLVQVTVEGVGLDGQPFSETVTTR